MFPSVPRGAPLGVEDFECVDVVDLLCVDVPGERRSCACTYVPSFFV